MTADERDRVVEARMTKLEALRTQGVEPFAYAAHPTHTITEARTLFEHFEASSGVGEGPEDVVCLAGRVIGKREMGKVTFLHLADRSERIQLYLRVNELGEERFRQLSLIDLGDWISVEGQLFRTRSGEVTVRASMLELLSKAIRPLPFGKEEIDPQTGERHVYSGFADREARYRQRYADLAVNPEVREVFVLRARIVSALRRFLDERRFVEVETPVLQPVYGGALARPFTTHHNALDTQLYLRIADELYLKRLIVGGMERVYEIGKDFRNEGLSRFHNPEFTMLEFYAAYLDYEGVMDLTEEMLAFVAREATGGTTVRWGEHEIDFAAPFRRLSMYDAVREFGGVEGELDDASLRARVRALGVDGAETMGRGKLIDELFGTLVEPKLIQPTFIIDYPREMSPLAKPKRGDPELTERFELIAGGKELCNAYSELNDPIDQRERFEAQN
nr:lysine--tRNA ligase [Gemmatimonadota bacterium]